MTEFNLMISQKTEIELECGEAYYNLLDRFKSKMQEFTKEHPETASEFTYRENEYVSLNFKPLEHLHPDLEIIEDDDGKIKIKFEDLDMGDLLYNKLINEFYIVADILIETKKATKIVIEGRCTFEDLLHFIIESHLNSGKSPEEIKFIFEKMGFDGL